MPSGKEMAAARVTAGGSRADWPENTVSEREHLHYVDLIRVLTVGLVIGMHTLSLAPVAPSVLLGALIIVFHVSREVFFLLTAFVLTYSTGQRPVRWPSFW